MWSFLYGKKTVIAAIFTAVIGALTQQQVISADLGNTLTLIGGALATIFLRMGMKNDSSGTGK